MRVLAICETLDFQNFTRRFTIEALARIHNETTALCHTHFKNCLRVNLYSAFLKVKCYYGFIPFNKKSSFLRKLETYINFRWRSYFDLYDIVFISSPNQNYLLDFIGSEKKVIYLISDPYCLMGYSKVKEKEILKRADLILATSLNLAHNYLPKYYGYKPSAPVIYWPNCADVNIWKPEKFTKHNTTPIIGFAGNLMKIVDLHLLEKVVTAFQDCVIVVAGKVANWESEYGLLLKRIFSHKNVEYKGFIPFEDLPKEVNGWDVCLMLDDTSELSSYHHHNKLYQYLALGKPVVIQRNHNDYDSLGDLIYISEDHTQFVNNVGKALKETQDNELFNKRVKLAKENSADVRAKQLMNEIMNLYAV